MLACLHSWLTPAIPPNYPARSHPVVALALIRGLAFLLALACAEGGSRGVRAGWRPMMIRDLRNMVEALNYLARFRFQRLAVEDRHFAS